MQNITLEQIEQIPKEMLTAADICSYLRTDPSIIRWQAQYAPEKLGFPVIVMKSRVKIPKKAFLYYSKHGRLDLEKANNPIYPC